MEIIKPMLPMELFAYLGSVLPNGQSLGIEPYLKVLINFLQRVKKAFVSTGTIFVAKVVVVVCINIRDTYYMYILLVFKYTIPRSLEKN
jgi:hypothetical protein